MSDIILHIDPEVYRELVVKAGKNLDIAIEECQAFRTRRKNEVVGKTWFRKKNITAWDKLVEEARTHWDFWRYILESEKPMDIDRNHVWMIVYRWDIEKMLNVKHKGVTEVVLTNKLHKILVKAAHIYDEKEKSGE